MDEELSVLDESVRRLKVEYDVYFGGGSKKPPADTEWRVHSLIKKYSDSNKLNFAQRFRYNSILQKYSLYNSLWQQKLRIKEEGYRRPQDAVLGISGLRQAEERSAAAALDHDEAKPFSVACSDTDKEQERVKALFEAMVEAKKKAGEAVAQNSASFESFRSFVKRKTEQIRQDFGCQAVEYTVEVQGGQVKLKAKAK